MAQTCHLTTIFAVHAFFYFSVMSSRIIVCFIASFVLSKSWAQNLSIFANPSTAKIILDGIETRSNSSAFSNIKKTSIVIACDSGYISEHLTIEEMLKKTGSKGEFKFQLTPYKKLSDSTKTKKIKLARFVDATTTSNLSTYLYESYLAPEVYFDDHKSMEPFTKEMSAWGYRMTGNLSTNKSIESIHDLTLTGNIKWLTENVKKSGLQISLLVEWSLFDQSLEKEIKTWQIAGYSDKKTTKSFNEQLDNALHDATRSLMSNVEFQKVTKLGHKSSTLISASDSLVFAHAPFKRHNSYGEMIKTVAKSVVTIKTDQGHGSGFFISSDGYVLTNYHVVDKTTNMEVILENGYTFGASLIAKDEKRDVAILKMPGKNFKPLLADTDPESYGIGTEVIAIGTPMDIDLGQTVTKGIVSGKREFDKQSFIQTDVSISPGNSGGPLINSSTGHLIGIIVSKVMEQNVSGIGFAIPIEEALRVLNIKLK